MKEMNLIKVLMVAMALGFPAYAGAEDVSENEAAIQAQCEAEAQNVNAASPQDYIEQCVEEKIQAQKEQAQESREAS